jgi:hypothetical protein
MEKGCELESRDPEQGPMEDCYEHGNELSGFHKRRGIFWPAGWLSMYEERR